jgi:hypothetical protein
MVKICVGMTFDKPVGLVYDIIKSYKVWDLPLLKRHSHTLKGRGL